MIQFTHEIHKDGQLQLLDINLNKENDGTISNSVFQKRTHRLVSSVLFLPSLGSQSFCCRDIVFKGIITVFFPGAVFTRGKKHIFDALRTIGYPKNLIQRRSISQRSETEVTKEKLVARVTLPYIQGASEAIRWVLKDMNITSSFRLMTSLRKVSPHSKDPFLHLLELE